jgi:hydroxymethylbilane synthase
VSRRDVSYRNRFFVFTRTLMARRIRIGTRRSKLALHQTNVVASALRTTHPSIEIEIVHMVTQGDLSQTRDLPLPPTGLKGMFTAELERGLAADEIDIAVHSLKDVPTLMAPEFCLGAILSREATEDVLISRSGVPLDRLPKGCTIGTTSVRRTAQLLTLRRDAEILPLRGNIDTRLRRALDPAEPFDAIVLAKAGLDRLGLSSHVTQVFTPRDMLPAAGQGALAVQCRTNDSSILELLQSIHDPRSAAEVSAERAFTHALEAGCNTPVAAQCEATDGGRLAFTGRCFSPDGMRMIEVIGEASRWEDAQALGESMGLRALEQGFRELDALALP